MALIAVLFDLDGVLVDSEGAGMEIARQVTQATGLFLTESELHGFVGISDRTFYESLARWHPGFDATIALARHEVYYLSVLDDLAEVPGAVALVKECAQQGLRLALVTGSISIETRRILSRLEIESLFSAVITAEDVLIGKPDCAGYRLALRRLAAQETQAVAIEDSDPGIAAAQSAHVPVVALRRACSVRQGLAGADRVVDRLDLLTVDVMRALVLARRVSPIDVPAPEGHGLSDGNPLPMRASKSLCAEWPRSSLAPRRNLCGAPPSTTEREA